MPVFHTPGLYRRPQRTEQQDVRLVRTDVAGFVGFAERGPLVSPDARMVVKADDFAVRLTGWEEFRATFGEFIPYGHLAFAVRAFFDNGGATCHVVRVAATDHARQRNRPQTAAFALPGDAAPTLIGTLAALSTSADPLRVDRVTPFDADSLLEIVGEGVSEFHLAAEVADAEIRLRGRLRGAYPKGALVRSHPATLVVQSTSAGNWGNRIRLDVTPLLQGATVTEFALRVIVEPGAYPSQRTEEEFYRRLSLNPDDPAFAPRVVNSRSKLIQILKPAVSDTRQGRPLLIAGGPLKKGPLHLQGGRDGLSSVTARDFTGAVDDLRGLRLLEEIDQVSILCAPDACFQRDVPWSTPSAAPPHPCAPPREAETPEPIADDPTAAPPALDSFTPTIYQAMIDQCERLRDRVAILDSPPPRVGRRVSGRDAGETAVERKRVVQWRETFTSRFAALYYPWLKVADPLSGSAGHRTIPPSGHVAGVYARIDNQFGVHRPPANAALEGVIDLVEDVSAIEQEDLNPYSINVLRSFPGRGIRVWGARSLAARADTPWRFIHARRLMSMIEESVEDSTEWAVFEPNDENLRRTLVHSISVFLRSIWQQGGLDGATPVESYFVKCDETNNPPAVVEAGQLICQVGVAVAAPMEFLVFEIRQKPSGAEIVER